MTGTLHIVRMDVLLHALGGFEERRDRPRGSDYAYTDFQVREIRKLARQSLQRGRYSGEVVRQAKRLGLPYKSLLNLLSRARAGLEPKAWSYVS